MNEARRLIDQLNLIPHPEGGWYAETWKGPAPGGGRATASLIHFLLEAGQKSHWHKVDGSEIWLWHAGDPVDLGIAADDVSPPVTTRLGPDLVNGHAVQAVVPEGHWQAATPVAGAHGFALVSCVVAPAFDFSRFTLAPPGWAPGA